MKNLFFLLIIFTSCNEKRGELQYINLYITTVIAISCDDLSKSGAIKNLILSKDETTELLKLFAKLKPADSDWKVDARVSGFIVENSRKLNFCMSTTVIDINGQKYFVNDELRNFILKITS